MKSSEKNRMYDNPILELLSLSGPKMMVSFHLILIGISLFIGYRVLGEFVSNWQVIALFLLGIFSWSLAEYVLHRHLFHFTNSNKFVKAFHFAMHGYHHENPTDTNRLFMPPVPAFLFLVVFFGLFYLFLGSYTWFYLPGFEFGYLSYSFMHYSMHARKAPKSLEKLWHHHIVHHYKEPEKAFGVSSRIWDRLFGTMPETRLNK
jgi:sterol desaturase/sphingolipid hydroxylase (fatty acid hydroxylase superfamily)